MGYNVNLHLKRQLDRAELFTYTEMGKHYYNISPTLTFTK